LILFFGFSKYQRTAPATGIIKVLFHYIRHYFIRSCSRLLYISLFHEVTMLRIPNYLSMIFVFLFNLCHFSLHVIFYQLFILNFEYLFNVWILYNFVFFPFIEWEFVFNVVTHIQILKFVWVNIVTCVDSALNGFVYFQSFRRLGYSEGVLFVVWCWVISRWFQLMRLDLAFSSLYYCLKLFGILNHLFTNY